MSEDIRWKQRFNNYTKAFDLLKRVSKDVSIANEQGTLASIQAFEVVMELSWKLLKDMMQNDGLSFQPTPKAIFRQAFNHEYIADGQVWLDAIELRNLTSHTYNQDTAEELLEAILHRFIPAFDDLHQAALKMSLNN